MQTPGLTDLQVNGYAGIDFNDAALTADALDHALAAMRRANVTTCLPTLITADRRPWPRASTALDAAVANSRLGPIMVPGFHLEGPFLNPAPGYAGCHPAEAMISPDPAVLSRLTAHLRRPVLLLTLAPERPGALPLIAGRAPRAWSSPWATPPPTTPSLRRPYKPASRSAPISATPCPSRSRNSSTR